MLDLPKSAVFGKRIPKKKFYDNLTVTAQIERIFVEQINLITWQYKIAPTTINISEGESVKEIEVIVIRLNQRKLDKRVLALIDKELPYHIQFLLEYEGEFQVWVGYKEHGNKSVFKPGTYYNTDWLQPDALNLRIDGLDMDTVYENFIRQVAETRLRDSDNGIKEAIDRDKRRQLLTKKIAALEKKVKNEQQFNRQVELNSDLKRFREELEGLK